MCVRFVRLCSKSNKMSFTFNMKIISLVKQGFLISLTMPPPWNEFHIQRQTIKYPFYISQKEQINLMFWCWIWNSFQKLDRVLYIFTLIVFFLQILSHEFSVHYIFLVFYHFLQKLTHTAYLHYITFRHNKSITAKIKFS